MLGCAFYRLGVSNDQKELSERDSRARGESEEPSICTAKEKNNQRKELGDNKSRAILERCDEHLLPASGSCENGEEAKGG